MRIGDYTDIADLPCPTCGVLITMGRVYGYTTVYVDCANGHTHRIEEAWAKEDPNWEAIKDAVWQEHVDRVKVQSDKAAAVLAERGY